ncbi:RAMP superfamily CRISPR-associated protein [Alkalinema pantanalense CENA528]|uniref:RAMP superfamily CRISPR-associated protein n=1 Tax=Alkalinema pantanalense TaxID=1620705 RepID=UPI003D6E1204
MVILNQLTDRILQDFEITATIDTALCIGSGTASSSLMDKSIVRNAQGQLIIPGSHLKGRLRHECEKLARSLGWWIAESPAADKLCPPEEQIPQNLRQRYRVDGYSGFHCWISQWFGDPILPSRIVVNDLVCNYAKDELMEVIRPGVAINRRRQTAEDQKLFFRETSPLNAQLNFVGSIQIYVPQVPPEDIQAIRVLMIAALKRIDALGGSKSAGLGWLTWQLPQVQVTAEILNRLKGERA